jgi:hypothetical protein
VSSAAAHSSAEPGLWDEEDRALPTAVIAYSPSAASSQASSTLSSVVSATLLVGPVQRKHVDTVYTCLASNSNMTQASKAEVKLQMNRKLHCSSGEDVIA